MAVTKPLIINLSTSAVGIFLCLVALVTPGWVLILENYSVSVFYACIYKSGGCSAKSYTRESSGLFFLMIDVQLAGVLAIVLGVIGWLVLLVNAISKESTASAFVTSGIIMLVASTFEFVLLVKFVVFNIAVFEEGPKSFQLGFPYSVIISTVGLFLIMFTVVRIFIRNIKRENNPYLTTAYALATTNETYTYM